MPFFHAELWIWSVSGKRKNWKKCRGKNGKLCATLAFTNVACSQLDLVTCRCMHYENRNAYVPECVHLTPSELKDIYWLPKTCAYRLLKEGKPLPEWHPLITGDESSVHRARMSARGRAVSAKPAEEFIDYIVEWDDL